MQVAGGGGGRDAAKQTVGDLKACGLSVARQLFDASLGADRRDLVRKSLE